MDGTWFDDTTKSMLRSRRTALMGSAALALGGMLSTLSPRSVETAKKKKKKKKKSCRNCCRENGSPCAKKNAACKPALCSRFTVTASWDSDENYDTYLFVPNDEGASSPSPFIDKFCIDSERDLYPFASVNQNAEGPGDEVTSIFKHLPGRYEYWLELDGGAPAGDVTVTLRDKGVLVFTSTSPANPSESAVSSWHVFDLEGDNGDLDEIDELIEDNLPRAKSSQNTNVCSL